MEPIVELEMDGARSITSTDDERIAYVVVPSGLIRVDGAGTARPVTAAAGLDLEGIERLRWHRGSLIAVQRMPDGTRRIVQLRLSRNGQAVSAATVIHAAVPADSGPTFSTIAGEDLYFLAFAPTDTSGTGAGGGEIVVQRIALQ